MIFLTDIQHPRYAQALVDYLQTLGIRAHTRPDAGNVAIWIEDESRLPEAQQELARFLDEPDHQRYWQASWLVEEDDTGAAQQLSRYYRGPSIWLYIKTTGWVTKLIVVLCVLVYAVTDQGDSVSARAPLMFFPSVEAMLHSGQLWRWITPAILHFGIFHISFNLFAWWIFGGAVERMQSSMRLLGLFLSFAVIGNVAQFLWGGNQFGGLSGVVYGVLGYLWVYGLVNPNAPFRLPKGMVALIWIMMAIGFVPILPFANLAHLGGLLAGCLFGAALAKLDLADANH